MTITDRVILFISLLINPGFARFGMSPMGMCFCNKLAWFTGRGNIADSTGW